MKQVGELNFSVYEPRKKFWIETLKLPLMWKDFSNEDLNDPLATLKSDKLSDGLLLSTLFTENILTSNAKVPSEVVEAGLVDSIVRTQGVFWVRCFLKEALRQSILGKSPSLDTHSIAYITGSELMTRLSIVVAAHMGFRRFMVVTREPEAAELRIAQLKKLFFDLEIKVIKDFELTLQPNNGSLLINTYTPEDGGEVFADLTYLNFLKPEGLVVDLPFSAKTNDLLEEAAHVKIPTLTGLEIWGTRDYFFLSAVLGPELQMTLPNYLLQWREFINQSNTVQKQT